MAKTGSKTDLLTLVQSELSDADQNLDFETPLDYYLGNPNGKEVEGRSQVTSTDVADSIEWIKPQIMKSFTQNNEVVIFDPIHEGDEFQAELESQYVYEILMKENDGFIILHQFIQDCLLQNNGFIKVWYENSEETKTKEYTGLDPAMLQAALMHPNAELVSKTESVTIDPKTGQPIPRVDAKIAVKTDRGRIMIESVSPEDFRVNSDHNSVNLDNARFTAHLLTKTVSDLREEGVSENIIEKLVAGDSDDNSDYRFSAQGEHTGKSADSPEDESLKQIEIAECYLRADVDDDGIAEFVKVTVNAHDTPSVIIDQEEISCSPWVTTVAILMSHKWRGLSLYDRLKELQDQKTALLRNSFDSIYFQNNQRFKVLEGAVDMSDLSVSRPNGLIRVKRMDALEPIATNPISQDTFTMLEYLDRVRAGRSGVSPEGELQQHKIGERVGSEGLERLMTAKEELVGLIVRIVAEVGLKPLCYKIRNLCTEHLDAVRDFKFRGQWIQVNPAIWSDRVRSTVRVGTGTGNHQAQIAALDRVLMKQAEINQQPGQVLLTPKNEFKALDDFCKFSGLNSAVGYFIDPDSPEGQQNSQQVQQQMQQQNEQQQQMMIEQLNVQKQLAQAEVEKANVARLNTELKAQVEKAKASLQHEKQRSDLTIQNLQTRIAQFKELIDANADDNDLQFKYDQLFANTALEVTKLETQAKIEQNKNYQENLKDVEDAA